jgi:hypothetical protein
MGKQVGLMKANELWNKFMMMFSKPKTTQLVPTFMLASEYLEMLIKDLKAGNIKCHKEYTALSNIEMKYFPHFEEWAVTKENVKPGSVAHAKDWNRFVRYLKKIYLKQVQNGIRTRTKRKNR